jgi:hypothetical protein
VPHREHEGDRKSESTDEQPPTRKWERFVHGSMLTAENARVRDGSASVQTAVRPTPFE